MPLTVEGLRVVQEASADKPIVDGVSFHLQDRSLTLLIGATGSGKTTLLRAISGLVELAEGKVCYDDKPLWIKPGKADRTQLLRQAISFQFPEHQLFANSIAKEFAYSLKPYRLDRKERLLRSEAAMCDVNLSNVSLNGSPFALSGGQKRRLAVATALSTRTPWLLLDEPSAGMDGRSLHQLKEHMCQWKQAHSIVMATHDWETFLPIADRVLLIANGRLLADLQPDALLEQPELLQQAGVGCPASLRVTHALQQVGIVSSSKLYAPEELAESILHAHANAGSGLSAASATDASWSSGECADLHTYHSDETSSEPSDNSSDNQVQRKWVYRQLAGLKWLMYTTLSFVILFMNGWWGAGIAMLLACGSFMLLTKQDVRQGIRLSRPLLYFILIAGTISGLRWTSGDWTSIFDLQEAMLTVRRMSRFFAITLIGFVFTLSTSTAEMKRGLERALRWGERVLPIEMISLAAALILRFVPLIVNEAQRFSVITAARGKKLVKQGKVRLRDVHVFVIPLLLSLFQMVEDFITAMEIKGHRPKGERK